MSNENIREQLQAARAEVERLAALAEPTTEEKLAAALADAAKWQSAAAEAQAKLSVEVTRCVDLSAVPLRVVACANRSLGCYTSDEQAQAIADGYNAARPDPHPDNEVHVVAIAEYVQQLEAAVKHVEWLHAEQKRHMKQHFPQAPVGPKSIS